MKKDQKDKSLLQKIKQSDPDAFKDIFSKYQPILFKYIFYITKDYSLTQDIVQETFLKVWLNRKSLKPDFAFLSLLNKISNNLIKDHNKRERIRDKHTQNVPSIFESNNGNPETNLDLTLLENKINSIVEKHLPEKCRLIFVLSRVEGKSNQEITSLLNITQKTVENQLYHALKVIRKKLKKFL